MKKFLLVFSLILFGYSNAQNISPDLSLERMAKPNFFPNDLSLSSKKNKDNSINKQNKITIHNFLISEKEQEELGIKNSEIQKFTDYYLKKTQDYFKNKNSKGSVIFLTDVSAVQPEDKNVSCLNKPTLCSVTSLGLIFSDEIPNDIKKDFQNYLDSQAKKDGIEIFISNFSSSSHFKLGFQISLKDDEKNDILSQIIISKFLTNTLFKNSNSKSIEI